MKDVDAKEVMRCIRIPMTEPELAEAARDMAAIMQEVAAIDVKKAEHARMCKDERERLEARLHDKAAMVKVGIEREVRCIVTRDYAANEYRVERADDPRLTDEERLIESRALTAEELQANLGLVPPDDGRPDPPDNVSAFPGGKGEDDPVH